MPNWTIDQQSAIDASDSNLLVSAAAGSGKTAVLVERIIKLVIEKKVSIDTMLIVTFTNAAASEMRERILGALYSKLETDIKNGEYLRQQINLISKSYIMTLHAFCIGLIKNNAHFIDLDPGFKVGDTIELNLLASEVMDELLEESYEKLEKGFINVVECYSENREDYKLQKIIIDIYKFIQSQPEPIEWLKECLVKLKSGNGEYYKNQVIKDILFDLNNAMDILECAADLCSDDIGPIEYDEMINDDINTVERLKEYIVNDFDKFLLTTRNIKHLRLKSISKARKEIVDISIADEVKDLRSNYKSVVDDIIIFFENKSLDDYVEDIKEVYPVISELFKLVERYDFLYSEKKLDKSIVDFNDLEHFALKALKNEDVKLLYKNKFTYIFLDEYQDSNLVQETLINSIKRDNNLFLVGDVKQSIYKFRLADPSLFMSKYKTFSKEEGSINRRIDLKKNFRSREEVLYGINYIFKSLMSEEFGEMEYDEDAMLYKGLEFKEIENPRIDVKIVEGKYEGDFDDPLKELTTAEIEAKVIVEEVKKLIKTKSYNRKTEEYFDLKYKDIVILMRAVSAWTPVFADVFLKEGIPLFADSRAGYFDTLEIKMFVDLLKLIDNKLQDLPLLTVLRSPIFNFNINELISIRNSSKKGNYSNAFYEYPINNKDDLSIKIDLFKEKIKKWKNKSRYLNLDELLWEIMTETGYYNYVGIMPGGKGRQGNLRLLIDRAEQMEKTSISGLFNFISIINKMKISKTELGTAKTIGENENVVRIMSIHKSKGLEFPVVIISGMGKKFNLRDSYGDILLHKNHGIGPKLVNPVDRVYFDTLPKKIIKRAVKFESLSEEMRVLYVGLTRAVDKLILVGTIKSIETQSKKWCRGSKRFNLISAQSYFDWILSIISNHVDGKIIWEIAGKENSNLENDLSKWNIEIINREDLFENLSEKIIKKENMKNIFENLSDYKNEDINNKLEKGFSYIYKHSTAHLMPSKLSVSDIKMLKRKDVSEIGYKFDLLLEKPKFMEVNEKLSGAEKGTLTHFIMQKIDRLIIFNEKTTIRKQIDLLISKKIVTKEDVDSINIESIENFFDSLLGKRFINSKNVYIEKPFVLKKKLSEVFLDSEDEVMIQGIIDCYFEEDGEIVLIDYKTDYLEGESQTLIKRYKDQLNLYKEAVEKITNKKVKETYIYSFFRNEAIKL